MSRPRLLAFALVFACASCATILDPAAEWREDATGTHQFGISSGWAFVEATVELDDGTGPLATPPTGQPEGDSTTDLDPVFGLGIKYLYYVTNNWSVGGIYEHRIFDPESTRPLSADVDIDEFGSDHFILDVRYTFDAMGESKRWRPYGGLQLGYIPEITADGTVDYGNTFGFATTERIRLKGDEFYTLGALIGTSYLLRQDLSLDISAFYEWPLDETEGDLVLNAVPGSPSTYKGKLSEEGLYLSIGLSWFF